MAQAFEKDRAILAVLRERGPCKFDELIYALPGYTWNQVFAAVDRLSREGGLTLQRSSPFGYLVSLGSGSRGQSVSAGGGDGTGGTLADRPKAGIL
jgi:hypothetical protein